MFGLTLLLVGVGMGVGVMRNLPLVIILLSPENRLS